MADRSVRIERLHVRVRGRAGADPRALGASVAREVARALAAAPGPSGDVGVDRVDAGTGPRAGVADRVVAAVDRKVR